MQVESLGEAITAGWRVHARCLGGVVDNTRSRAKSHYQAELSLETLVWTRGRSMPPAGLRDRMMCPKCGNRRVNLIFEPPPIATRVPVAQGFAALCNLYSLTKGSAKAASLVVRRVLWLAVSCGFIPIFLLTRCFRSIGCLFNSVSLSVNHDLLGSFYVPNIRSGWSVWGPAHSALLLHDFVPTLKHLLIRSCYGLSGPIYVNDL